MVKAFNTTGAENMADSSYAQGQPMMPVAGDDAAIYALIRENVVYRAELPVIRKQRRCLPAGAQKALDALPHHHSTAVEYSQD